MKPQKKEPTQSSSQFSRPTPGVLLPFLWGIGFIILAIGLWQSGPIIAKGYNVLIPYGFSILLLLLGIATIWSCIYQFALRRIPAAVIDLPGKRIFIGKENSVTLTQPGKVYLAFLRLRLICIEQKVTLHKRASRGPNGQLETYSTTKETVLHQQTLIEASNLDVQADRNWQETKSFTIPADARASRDSDSKSILWRLELSGRSGLLMRFLHSYEVRVS